MQPDRCQLDRVLGPVVQFLDKGGLLPSACGQAVDHVDRGGQHAIGCGIVLPGEGQAAGAAVVVCTQDQDQVCVSGRALGLLPDLGIDRPSARIVDVWADQPADLAGWSRAQREGRPGIRPGAAASSRGSSG